jgi:hypothetical protein
MSLTREDHPRDRFPARSARRTSVRAVSEVDPFPGDTHWYDLPDDDAEPEEGAVEAVSRWRFWRTARV